MLAGALASAGAPGSKEPLAPRMKPLKSILARTLSARDRDAYDSFVDDAPGGSYAQARAWAPVAVAGRRFTPQYFLTRREGSVVGAALVLRPKAMGPLLVPVAIVERGPVTARVDDLPEVLTELRRALRRRGVLRLQVMPYWADRQAAEATQHLARAGFRSVQTFDGAHARTLRVELTDKTGATVFAGKAGEALRRKLRQAEKAGATARRGTRSDLRALETLYAELMGGQGRGGKPKAYFDALGKLIDEGRRGAIFLCEHEGAVVSALFASRHGRLATFVVGASSAAEKTFSKMAPAMNAAVQWALEGGAEAFDMGGIPLEGDPDEKRRSIAQFKLDFAKNPVALVTEHARWG